MNHNCLLLLIAVFGFLVHALSTDGGGTVLMYLGVPATVAIPKWAINPLLLLAGLGDAIFEGVNKGLTWQDAATQGALASLVALGGAMGSQHTLGRDDEGHSRPVTPPKGLLMLVGALAFAASVTGCAAFAQDVAKYGPTPSEEACVLAEVENGDIVRPLDVAIKCGIPETLLADVIKLIEGGKIAKATRLAHAHAAAVADLCDAGPPARTLNFGNDNDAGKTDAGQ